MRRAFIVGATVFFALHCGSGTHDVRYSRDGDTTFAASIEGVWQTRDGLATVTLCEDTALDAERCARMVADVGGGVCDDDVLCHPIHGAGGGRDETLHRRTGGGCTCKASSFGSMALALSLSHPTISSTLHGQIDVDPLGDDAYGGPVTIDEAIGRAHEDERQFHGSLDRAAGTLHLSIFHAPPARVARPAVGDAAPPDASSMSDPPPLELDFVRVTAAGADRSAACR